MSAATHLIKLCVGVEDIDHLNALQADRLARSGELVHITRQRPKREAGLVDGGSLYWVIKGVIRVRQRVLGLRSLVDEEGTKRCAIILDPILVPTAASPFRAFQGWRYLDPAKVPDDAPSGTSQDVLPAEMVAELRDLGVF